MTSLYIIENRFNAMHYSVGVLMEFIIYDIVCEDNVTRWTASIIYTKIYLYYNLLLNSFNRTESTI